MGDLDPLAPPPPRALPEPPVAGAVGGEEGSSFTGEFLLTRVKCPWCEPVRGVFIPEEAFEEHGMVVVVVDVDATLLVPSPPSSPSFGGPPAPGPMDPMLMRLAPSPPPSPPLLRRRRRLGVARLQLEGAAEAELRLPLLPRRARDPPNGVTLLLLSKLCDRGSHTAVKRWASVMCMGVSIWPCPPERKYNNNKENASTGIAVYK